MKYEKLAIFSLASLLYHPTSYATVVIQPHNTGPAVFEPKHPNQSQHQQGPAQAPAADHEVKAIGVVAEEHREGYKVYIKQDMGGKREFGSHEILYLPKSIIQGHPLRANQEILITHVTSDRHAVEVGNTKVIVGVDLSLPKTIVNTAKKTEVITVKAQARLKANLPPVGDMFKFVVVEGSGPLKKDAIGQISAKVLDSCGYDQATRDMRNKFPVGFYITKVSVPLASAGKSSSSRDISEYEVMECQDILRFK